MSTGGLRDTKSTRVTSFFYTVQLFDKGKLSRAQKMLNVHLRQIGRLKIIFSLVIMCVLFMSVCYELM